MTRRKQFQKILFAFFCLLVLLCAFLAVCFPHSHSSVDSDCHVCLLQELYHYAWDTFYRDEPQVLKMGRLLKKAMRREEAWGTKDRFKSAPMT